MRNKYVNILYSMYNAHHYTTYNIIIIYLIPFLALRGDGLLNQKQYGKKMTVDEEIVDHDKLM